MVVLTVNTKHAKNTTPREILDPYENSFLSTLVILKVLQHAILLSNELLFLSFQYQDIGTCKGDSGKTT